MVSSDVQFQKDCEFCLGVAVVASVAFDLAAFAVEGGCQRLVEFEVVEHEEERSCKVWTGFAAVDVPVMGAKRFGVVQ